jgi:transcriptional regulator with XRE-family HTH domain
LHIGDGHAPENRGENSGGRLKAGLTQAQLAERLDRAQRTVSFYEQADDLSTAVLRRLAAALGAELVVELRG